MGPIPLIEIQKGELSGSWEANIIYLSVQQPNLHIPTTASDAESINKMCQEGKEFGRWWIIVLLSSYSTGRFNGKRVEKLIETGHGDILLGDLALLHGLGAVLAIQERLAILVEVELGDLDLRGVDSDRDGSTCGGEEREMKSRLGCQSDGFDGSFDGEKSFDSPVAFSRVNRSTWMTNFLR